MQCNSGVSWCQAAPEVGDAQVRLLAVAQVGLRDEDVPHGQHAQATDLLGRVEDDRREARGHLTVQPNLDTLQGRARVSSWPWKQPRSMVHSTDTM